MLGFPDKATKVEGTELSANNKLETSSMYI